MRPSIFALTLVLFGCDKPASTVPEAPSNVTEFHVSIFNACTNDVTVEVGEQPGGGRKVYLFQQARETIQGGREKLFLVAKGGEVLATYQPIQGRQKAQVTADCTAIERMPQ